MNLSMNPRPTPSSARADGLLRGSVPALHERLTEHLRSLVKAGEFGSKLPTEDMLVNSFGVSRTTVRRAIDTLVQEGEVVRRQGRGTFVTGQRVSSLDYLSPFVSAFGEDEPVETRLLKFDWVSGESVPQSLGGPQREALVFQRLYLTDAVPHALVHGIVLDDIARDITRAQLEAHPIYHVLQNELGLALSHAEVTVSSRSAEPEIAELLAVEPGSSLLVLERSTALIDGRIAEVATQYLLPDAYRFTLTVRGGSLSPLIRLPRHPPTNSPLLGPESAGDL